MSSDWFLQIVAAVFVGNALFGIVIYALWRATKLERKYGYKNGGDYLPFPLLLAMLVAFGLPVWGILLLN